MSDHSETVIAQKAKLDKESDAALKKDIGIHDARSKKASETKEENIADKQEQLVQNKAFADMCHICSKEACEHNKEEACKRDFHYHEEHQDRAAHIKQELADKQQEDFETLEHDLEEHRKKAPA